MTPCQALTEVEQETKPEIQIRVKAKEDMSLRCMSNCEDTAFDMEGLSEQRPAELVVVEETEVDIVGCSRDGSDFRSGQEGDETEATEYSSSFGNTCSGDDDDSTLSDSEVASIYYGDPNPVGFDRLFPMGRKKVSDHWRKFVSPVAWRGKWIELRLREMKSQLSKYDRELALLSQKDQFELAQFSSEEDFNVKSLPFSGQHNKREVMRRRKRTKIEEMVDVSSYMSRHNLFSHYENKKCDADGALVDEEPAIQAIAEDDNKNDDLDIIFEIREENSLEHILWKIEMVQSRVEKLRTQIDKQVEENAVKFSSVESLDELVESDIPKSSPTSPVISSGHVEKIPLGTSYTPPRHIVDYPERAVSNHGEAVPQTDIVECSIGPSSEVVRLDQSYFIDSCQSIANDITPHNQEVKKEPHEFNKLNSPLMKPLATVKEENVIDISIVQAIKPESQEAKMIRQNSVPRSSLPSDFIVPPTKKKRGERKASSGTWNADTITAQPQLNWHVV